MARDTKRRLDPSAGTGRPTSGNASAVLPPIATEEAREKGVMNTSGKLHDPLGTAPERRAYSSLVCRVGRLAVCALFAATALSACTFGDDRIELPPLELGDGSGGAFTFRCETLSDVSCAGTSHLTCRRQGEFLEVVEERCGDRGLVCDVQKGCAVCIPGSRRCQSCEDGDSDCDVQRVQVCNASGDAYDNEELCSLEEGDVCSSGVCANACSVSERERSYVGCEFYAVDLDNAAIDDLNNAAAQQFAVAVANPHPIAITVRVELNSAEVGDEPKVELVEEREVPPNWLEVFALPQREVDGSSVDGLNDGTHTALTSNAYRFVASHPVTLYQFNPLDNVDVFSNDASLLLPTSALGRDYTVVAWPQTIGKSEEESNFDATSADQDLRSFLTIVGTEPATAVTVTLGANIVRLAAGGPVSDSGPGDVVRVMLGAFDVLNLETAGTSADFTGSHVSASAPVSIFVGSEASDVPLAEDYSSRQCCADHLEEQLFPDNTLGNNFIVGHMPSRTHALALAGADAGGLGIAQVVETERVRVVAVREGQTRVRTNLPAPDDSFVLSTTEDRILVADQDFRIVADGPVAVLQALPSQGVTGIPKDYPGGDPAIVMVPPVEQYREQYIFLTPDKYAFDFVTVTAPIGTRIRLDGKLLDERDGCTIDELVVEQGDASPTQAGGDVDARPSTLESATVYRCQLSFPVVTRAPSSQVLPGMQDDGVHRLQADRPVGLVVYGFDSFVSYAYAGGLDLEPLF